MTARTCPSGITLCRAVPSRLNCVDAICRQLRAILKKKRIGDPSFVLELLARECLNNAVIHGNRGDIRKRVSFDLHSTAEWFRIQVTDEGPGFNWKRVRCQTCPDAAASSGRGLLIVAVYAHRVRFNRKGNRITIWLRKHPRARA